LTKDAKEGKDNPGEKTLDELIASPLGKMQQESEF
jgi:hypothetical protein